jgi:hypothetical protein
MIQDFRFAFRQLVKTPGLTMVAVITLALAIGMNSAILALINGVAEKSQTSCGTSASETSGRKPIG